MEKIPRIEIGGAKIERLPVPVIERLPGPVVENIPYPTLRIPKPVVDIPSPRVNYPVIPFVPPPAPKIGQSGQTQSQSEPQPKRSLPSVQPPPLPPVVQAPQPPAPTPVVPPTQRETKNTTIEIAGHEVNVPTPKEAVQAGVTAVIGTSVTLVTAMVFNQARRVVGEAVSNAARKKFKIKLRAVKPVIHMIDEGEGITVMEYSSEGIRTLATRVEDPEQYLRDTIEADELYEADHKIVIDENIRQMFSREGAKRFNYFAPAKKLARRLSARLTLG